MSPTIQTPAPALSVTALVDGDFKQAGQATSIDGTTHPLVFFPLPFMAPFGF
jgi:hypothetical protein